MYVADARGRAYDASQTRVDALAAHAGYCRPASQSESLESKCLQPGSISPACKFGCGKHLTQSPATSADSNSTSMPITGSKCSGVGDNHTWINRDVVLSVRQVRLCGGHGTLPVLVGPRAANVNSMFRV